MNPRRAFFVIFRGFEMTFARSKFNKNIEQFHYLDKKTNYLRHMAIKWP